MLEQTDQRIAKAEAGIERTLKGYRKRGLRTIASSSFQGHSLPLLHLLSRFDREIPVYFLDTGYHFPETIRYRRDMAVRLGLRVIDLRSDITRFEQRDSEGRLLFASDPDRCCRLNKTLPIEHILRENDVWISGLRRDQNAFRKNLSSKAPGPHGTIRYHPMLDWDARMIWRYRNVYDLPGHPLEERGYFSVGCEPCTHHAMGEDFRDARWAGLNKTECGLHTELIKRS